MKAFCTNNLYQNSWKAYQLILISQNSTRTPLNQARITCSHTKGNTNSNCGNCFKLNGYVLQGVKPQKLKELRSYTLTAFKMENAKKKEYSCTHINVKVYVSVYICTNMLINMYPYRHKKEFPLLQSKEKQVGQ